MDQPTREHFYTKEEVNMLIQAAVVEAQEMDAELMRKHNRNATIISMILGLNCLALLLDGLLRIPFGNYKKEKILCELDNFREEIDNFLMEMKSLLKSFPELECLKLPEKEKAKSNDIDMKTSKVRIRT